ncbi:hypothetical protein pb186bvf_002779 [Paramecium bursaria]
MGAVCAKRKIKHMHKGNIQKIQGATSQILIAFKKQGLINQILQQSPQRKLFIKFPSSDCLYNLQQLSNKAHHIYKCNSMFQIKICEQEVKKRLTEEQDYQEEASQENSDSYSCYGMKKIQYFQNSFSFYSSEKGSRSVISSSYQ